MQRTVTSHIVLDVTQTADLVFAIAVATAYVPASESLTATLDGAPVAFRKLSDAHGGRLHRLAASPGRLVVDYAATIDGEAAPLDLRLDIGVELADRMAEMRHRVVDHARFEQRRTWQF